MRARTALAVLCACAGVLLAGFAGSTPAAAVGSGRAEAQAGQQSPAGPVIDIVELDGVLDVHLVRYLRGRLDKAGAEGVEAVVVQLDVTGAYGQAAENSAAAVAGSTVPVVTWVGPRAARALGAGALVWASGHLRAAAPGTLIGAASPLDLATADPEAARTDDRARLRAAAEQGGADPALFAELAAGSVLVPVPDALADAGLPRGAELPDGISRDAVRVMGEGALVDAGALAFLAPTLPDVLRDLDGREVRVGGQTRVLEASPEALRVRFNNLGVLGGLLRTTATPVLAYLLIVGGALALAFELFQPGFGVAGVSGLVVTAFGIYGLVVLPVSLLGVALLVGGLALLCADLAVGGLGALTAGGTAAFALGSFLLFPGPAPLSVPAWVLVVVTVVVVVYFVVVMTAVLRAQGSQARADADALVGRTGVVRSVLNPEGHVFVEGQLWRARAPEDAGQVRTGTTVRVSGLDDRLTLEVEPVPASSATIATAGPDGDGSAAAQ